MQMQFNYIDIVLSFTKRNLNAKYKDSALGFLWFLLNPILTMLILSFVFSKFIKFNIDKYPLFLLSAILPWSFFTSAVFDGVVSVTASRDLIKKIYFPSITLPISSVLTNFVDFIFNLLVFVPVILICKGHANFSLLFLPVIISMHLLFTMGIVFLASCVNVFLTDVGRHSLGFCLILWFYLTPVFYPVSMVPVNMRDLYFLNPMASIVTMYRDLLFYNKMPDSINIIISLTSAVVLLFAGYSIFQKYKDKFAKEL